VLYLVYAKLPERKSRYEIFGHPMTRLRFSSGGIYLPPSQICERNMDATGLPNVSSKLYVNHGFATDNLVAGESNGTFLGDVDNPSYEILHCAIPQVKDYLRKRRNALRQKLVNEFSDKIQGQQFGSLNVLRATMNENLMPLHTPNIWTNPLLNEVIRAIFLSEGGAFSVTRFLRSRHIPIPTVNLALMCVSTSSIPSVVK
jgi:hypothetical protein